MDAEGKKRWRRREEGEGIRKESMHFEKREERERESQSELG